MIYLLEDDESIRELVIYTLKSQGYEAKGFERPSLWIVHMMARKQWNWLRRQSTISCFWM